MILNFEQFLLEQINESSGNTYFPRWRDDGILLIRGLPQRDGLTRLYAARVKRIVGEGLRGFFKAYTYPDFFIVTQKWNGDLDVNKIPSTPEILQRIMGIKSLAIGLNAKTGKTPLWEKSVQEANFRRFLDEFKDAIKDIPGIHFPVIN